MKKIVIAIITCLGLTAFVYKGIPKDFKTVLKRAHMTFEMPEGMVETKVIDNNQVGYDYALKYPDKRFEVRYAIMPLDSLVMEYEKSKKDTNEQVIEPNNLFDKMLLVTAMNASMGASGGMPQIKEFDSAAVKNEFNADRGGVVLVYVGKEFGQDYKYCLIVGIHKDNIADAFYFYLSDTTAGVDELMKPAFHSLKFKD